MAARTSWPVQRLATDWMARGSGPGGGEIFDPVLTGLDTHSTSCTKDTRYFLGVERPKRGVD